MNPDHISSVVLMIWWGVLGMLGVAVGLIILGLLAWALSNILAEIASNLSSAAYHGKLILHRRNYE